MPVFTWKVCSRGRRTSTRYTSIPVMSIPVLCLFCLRYVPHPSCSVCILCLFCSKYYDNKSKKIQLRCVYLNQVFFHNRSEHACTAPFSLKYEATAFLIRVHTLSVFLKNMITTRHASIHLNPQEEVPWQEVPWQNTYTGTQGISGLTIKQLALSLHDPSTSKRYQLLNN